MDEQHINRASEKIVLGLALTALITVLIGILQLPQSPRTDEGALARLFQLSVVAQAPVIMLFLATADWQQPWRSARRLALPLAILVLAFGLLYYFEH
jgi:hypothetical protein